MINVAITGAAGRMGRTLVAAISNAKDLALTAAIERKGAPEVGLDIGELAGLGTSGVLITDDLAAICAAFDVLIDFTVPEATVSNARTCAAQGKKMVVGTTGLSETQKAVLETAGAEVAIVFAPNYSIGVNVTFKLAEIAASILGDDVDIEITESHHRHKVDAPSGTALGLGEVVAKALGRNLSDVAVYGREGITGERDGKTIGFHSIRAGEIVGDHTVMFAAPGERIELTHRAQSRMNFAQGAVRAAGWIMAQPNGVYDMQDVLGLR